MIRFGCILCLLLLGLSPAESANTALSPVTRVAELLLQLSKKIEEEGKVEEDLYEKYVCWAKTVIDTKTASNAAAASRIQELETYIADLDAGRIELTDERSDLTKEIGQLNADLEEAAALREKEHQDFLEAEDEMNKARTALNKAIEVLQVATESHKEGVLVQQGAHLAETFKVHAAEASSMAFAAELGDKYLSKGDATFLRRVLTGDVPERADWKTLNRKATFKMSYKARSFKIQDVLSKMLATFNTNLKEAQDAEATAQANYETLKEGKQAQLDKAEQAYASMSEENGARGLSKAEAQEEIDTLKTQVANDEKYIEQVTGELATMKGEWKTRSELRAGELEAISKTIAILRNDDARDLFKRSFESQGEAFIQESQHSAASIQKLRAAELLQSVAQKAHDKRLAALATTISSVGSHFDEVITAIDNMIALLKSEEEEDLKNKQQCEDDRMKDTRESAVTSRKIDDLSDTITRLESEIAELEKEIEEAQETIAKTKEQLEEATRLRQDEHAEYLLADKDDADAIVVVTQAIDTLSEFYTSNNLMLVQRRQAPVVEAGKAPPPPPATWEAPYGGRTDEAEGIVAIMEMIREDITKDKAKATEEENAAEASYQKLKEDSLANIQNLENAISEKQGIIASKKIDIENAQTEQINLKEQLDTVMKRMSDAAPGCDYITINYDMRLKNRQIEIDGLVKAKAILQGAAFDKGPDPNREIKPGDAFLQRRQ